VNNYFAIINPDAVFNNQSTEILENFVRSGLEIVSTLIYQLDKEEAALIFYSRRNDADFDEFCERYTAGTSWLVHFKGLSLASLAKHLTETQMAALYIPSLKVDHVVLLKMTASLGYNRNKLGAVVKDLREKLCQLGDHENREFATLALVQAQRLFTYYLSLQIVGFNKAQAFELVVDAQVGDPSELIDGEPPKGGDEDD